MKKIWCDLETFSPVPMAQGTHRYAEKARVLLWGYKFENQDAKVWDVASGAPMPNDLKEAVENPDVMTVWHNGAMFDTVVLKHALGIDLPIERIDDTMVKAYSHSLPGALSTLCDVLRVPSDKAKDKNGRRLVRLFCVPDRFGKVQTRETRPADWARFVEYCRLDVEALAEIDQRMPEWNWQARDREFFAVDQTINRRGICIDTDLAEACVDLAEKTAAMNEERAKELTNGELDSARQRDAVLKHILRVYGVTLPDLTKSTVERRLNDPDLPQAVKDLLAVRLSSTRTSIAKYKALLGSVSSDGRLRGTLQFRGAARTGRYCLTGDHEVLTPDGWKRLDEWTGGKIAVWNIQSEAISFQNSEALAFDYEGPMYQYDTVRCAQISTPDHRMPYMTKSGRWEVDTVENLASRSRVNIPFTGMRKAPATMEHDLLRVLIMTQADGRYTDDGQIVYNFKKLRKVERCKMLLRRVGIPFVVDSYDAGNTRIAIHSRYVPLWLRLFKGKEFGYWLFNESADVIFDELPEWDGYRGGPNSIQYCTCVKHNADLIQALAVLSGRTATVLIKKRVNESWQDSYVVNIWNTPGKAHCLPNNPVQIPFAGKIYCAKTPTGFFVVRRNGRVWITGNSGRLFQPQNLARPTMSQDEIDVGIDAIKGGWTHLIYDDPGELMSSCLRGVIVASPGKQLVVADLSNIEGRVLAWLAGEEWKLQAFREFDAGRGPDLYKATYGRTFGVNPNDVTKKQRQIGKVLELAMGYQGGVGAFLTFASAYRVDLDELAKHTFEAIDRRYLDEARDAYPWFKEKGLTHGLSETTFIACEAIKRAWRTAHPAITQYWADTETAIRETLTNGSTNIAGRIVYDKRGAWLRARLPSGRYLCYPAARLPQNDERCVFLYKGMNQYTRKWDLIKTYGGKCCENACQAVACDILVEAMPVIEAAGFEIVISVHDEFITEAPMNKTARELEQIMATPPAWAKALPLAAAGFESLRYRKE